MPTLLAESERAWQSGLRIHPQVAPRGIGAIYTLDGYHPFLRKNSYREIAMLPRKDRAAAMRDPARRAAILSEEDVDGEYAANKATMRMLSGMSQAAPRMFVQETPLNCEPGPERRVGALAEAVGKTAEEYLYDMYASGNGEAYSVTYAANYALDGLDYVPALFNKPNTVLGLGDAGAHIRVICDSSMPTFALAYWTRDRKRGARMPVEQVVRKLSADAANLYSMHDRGTLEVGKRADVNVIDYDRLDLKAPHLVKDLPSGGGRLLQDSEGYLATVVAGVTTRRNDKDTGARPGRLVRSRPSASA
jgi:N-acyl-D-aspartate/D-glutamate deacylase